MNFFFSVKYNGSLIEDFQQEHKTTWFKLWLIYTVVR